MRVRAQSRSASLLTVSVGRVLERLAHARVPRVGPHRAAVDPNRLAEARARRHLDLLLQQLLVVHRPVHDPQRLGIRPVKINHCPTHSARGVREACERIRAKRLFSTRRARAAAAVPSPPQKQFARGRGAPDDAFDGTPDGATLRRVAPRCARARVRAQRLPALR